MSCVLVLISNPDVPALDDALLAAMRRRLRNPGAVVWLADGIAAEIQFEPDMPPDCKTLEDALRPALDAAPVDLAVLPAGKRRKKLLLADMDSTMIGQECIDELADMLSLKPQVSAITERAMRGEIAFEPALRERVALLEGLDRGVIDTLLAERITPNPGAATLIATMRAHGAYTALVSGGFTAFTDAVAAWLGFDEARANTLLFDGDRMTGRVAEPILGSAAKLDALRDLRARFGLGIDETLGVGDGANDLAMIGEAGLGVAYHAKPAVAAAARARINHGDLTALLYLQGFTREQFVD